MVVKDGCSVKAVEVPERSERSANLDMFIILKRIGLDFLDDGELFDVVQCSLFGMLRMRRRGRWNG